MIMKELKFHQYRFKTIVSYDLGLIMILMTCYHFFLI